MGLPSASSLERAMLCTASAVLPKVGEIRDDSDMGTVIHDYLRRFLNGENTDAFLEEIKETQREGCKAVDLQKLERLIGCKTEVAVAYNPFTRTARVLGQNIGREYEKHGWKPKEEFPASIDYCWYGDGVGFDQPNSKVNAAGAGGHGAVDLPTVASGTSGNSQAVGTSGHAPWLRGDGRIIVGDFKTGSARTTAPAKSNWQLAIAAVAVSRLAADGDVGRGRRYSVLVEINKTREGYVDTAILDVLELDLRENLLLDLAKRVLEAQGNLDLGKPPQATTGDHCNYCPSFNYCPAQQALMWRVSRAPSLLADDIEAAIQANPGEAYMRYREVKRLLRKLDIAFVRTAQRSPIDLPDGTVYGPVATESETIKPDVALSILSDRYGNDVARDAATLEVTKAGIDRAVKRAKKDGRLEGSMAAANREIIELLRASGGVEKKVSTEMRITGKKND